MFVVSLCGPLVDGTTGSAPLFGIGTLLNRKIVNVLKELTDRQFQIKGNLDELHCNNNSNVMHKIS